MKILKLLCCIVVLFVLLQNPSIARADSTDVNDFGIISIGRTNNGLSIGCGTRDGNLGFEFGFLSNEYSEYNNLAYLPYTEPDYKVIGDKVIGDAFGGDLLFLMDPVECITLYVGLGLYAQKRSTIVQSNLTGNYFYKGL